MVRSAWQKGTNVSKEHNASIFKVEIKISHGQAEREPEEAAAEADLRSSTRQRSTHTHKVREKVQPPGTLGTRACAHTHIFNTRTHLQRHQEESETAVD